jgi:hypothetical protein
VEECAASWHTEWRRLHGLTGGLKGGPHADPWIASHAAKLLSCIPAHGRKLTALAGQIGLAI